ncbi:MAG: 50S ribosomal protein L21 [Chloroflexota bacterium]
MIYAIVETGGKQYRVSPGQTIEVDHLAQAKGDKVDIEKVLLLADGDQVTVGKPFVTGAKVSATVADEGKGKKLIVFKYKPKVRYHKKTGHRQLFTRLSIDSINGQGASEGEKAKEEVI